MTKEKQYHVEWQFQKSILGHIRIIEILIKD